ncbi:hypothetical protein L3067_01365 [Xanthomonas sp. PPL568]|uniref:hypothetical protein n=1 Tax=Xanthomonas indica TaxID=2912242 RepID=UPI001F56A447|nr:hypothetical protein [Xanthomonas indica]MCI2243258.1 hypothetical protein [Xanthomonas indica]
MKVRWKVRFAPIPSAICFGVGGLTTALVLWPALGSVPAVLKDPLAPSWIQAVGSLAGIGAVIGIAVWTHLTAKADRAARELLDKKTRYVLANRILDRFLVTIRDAIAVAEKGAATGPNFQMVMQEVPQEVRDLESHLHLMADAGGPGYTAINAYEDARRLLETGVLRFEDQPTFFRCIRYAEERCGVAGVAVRIFLFDLDP